MATPPTDRTSPRWAARAASGEERPLTPRRALWYDIIFEADTPAGKAFDVALLLLIVLSVAAVMLESVEAVRLRAGALLLGLEWTFTVIFTFEYIARLVCVRRPSRYALSFFGIVDLLAILPTYLSIFFAGSHALLIIRVLRLLRTFRVFKLTRFMGQASMLASALKSSREKIIVFLGAVLSTTLIMGSLMYLVEGPENGFTNIPRSVYWAIVTMTTVGYGDIAPQTIVGQIIASFMMILGYGIIAVPTGIVTVELAEAARGNADTVRCPSCDCGGHDPDAVYCRRCGTALHDPAENKT